MRIFELTTHVNAISRSQGRTNQNRRASRMVRDAWQEATRQDHRERQIAENKALRERQNDAWRAKSRQWEDQKREAVRRIMAEARAARREEPRIGVLRLFLLRVTGQTAKLNAARKERAETRLASVRAQIGALRHDIDRQKDQARAAQQSERQFLKDRHANDNVRLSQAFSARVSRDLAAERAMRSAGTHEQGREHQRDEGGRSLNLEL